MKKRIFAIFISAMITFALITPIHGEFQGVGLVVVSDLESLLLAIGQAGDGDTILIDDMIIVEANDGDLMIGNMNKRITLMRANGFNGGLIYVANVGNNRTSFNNRPVH